MPLRRCLSRRHHGWLSRQRTFSSHREIEDEDELDPEIGMYFDANWHLTELLGVRIGGFGLQSLVDQIAKILEEDPAAFARVLQHRAEVLEKQVKKKAEQEARGW